MHCSEGWGCESRGSKCLAWGGAPSFATQRGVCEDRVLDGPASGEMGSKGRNWLD